MSGARFPEPVAAFFLGWMNGIDRGEWDEQPGDLERLIGHKPTATASFLRESFDVSATRPAPGQRS